jgi:hypothetical protein
MTLQEYVEEVKLMLTGGVLNLEIPDEVLEKVIKKSFREIQRYIDETRFVTVPYVQCIDLTGFKSSAIVGVYRVDTYTGTGEVGSGSSSAMDPMYAQRWMIFGNTNNMHNLNEYILNYLSYNTLLQMSNTMGTDLSFIEEHDAKKLYIYTGTDRSAEITIEFIPIFEDVSQITSDYWVDILSRLSIAQTKIILGRIRSRFEQSNSLWKQDGDVMLTEGNAELNSLQETLRVNSQLGYPID